MHGGAAFLDLLQAAPTLTGSDEKGMPHSSRVQGNAGAADSTQTEEGQQAAWPVPQVEGQHAGSG